MSNVLKRNRNLSDFEFYKNALLIRTEVIKVVNNEKYVTKRRRISIGDRALGHALDLVEQITKANAAYPSTPEMLFIRKLHQQNAIGECEALIETIRVIIELNNNGKTDKLVALVYKIASEVELLKRWMKRTKLLSHSKKYLDKFEPNNSSISDPIEIEEENLEEDDDTGIIKLAKSVKEKPEDFIVTKNNMTTSDKSVGNLFVQLMILLEGVSRYTNLV